MKLQAGQNVIVTYMGRPTRATIARVVDADYFAIDIGHLRAYRFRDELTPIEDAPKFVTEQASRAG